MAYPHPSQLLPHAGQAILIDEVLDETDDDIRVLARICPEHPFFVSGQGVPVWAGLEMMAQAVAAHASLRARRRGQAPHTGMLLGTRRYHGHVAWFLEGQNLEIRTHSAFGSEGGAAACRCRIESDGKVLAEATIVIIEGTLA